MKKCTGCDEAKPLSGFYADNRTKDGKGTRCKPCHEERYANWKRANRQKVLGYNRKWYVNSNARLRRYGLTPDDYKNLEDSQGGVCAICRNPETIIVRGKVRPLHIDHDHKTGSVRGLLCSACNTGIGKFGDDPDRLSAAARYLGTAAEPSILPPIG